MNQIPDSMVTRTVMVDVPFNFYTFYKILSALYKSCSKDSLKVFNTFRSC